MSMSNPDEHSLLPIGPGAPEAPDTSNLPPALQECAEALYEQAWRKYRKAGCPYGPTDEALLVWYALHGKSPNPAITGKN